MKLKEIHRTSTFAWSPCSRTPLLATGTVAGALDESFSNESLLEIWEPDFLERKEFDLGFQDGSQSAAVDGQKGKGGAKGHVTDASRFNRLRWGYTEDAARPHGILAAGMENGELALWDPAKIIAAGSSADSDSLILRNTTHTGPIRGLSFNPIQRSLLASGATAGEVYIWDLKDPSKPYTPTTESAAAAGPGGAAGGAKKLEDITSIEWNRQVPYILAGASSTGYCVVWDLRGKREVVALSFSGGGTGMGAQGPMGPMGGMMMGASTRRGISDIAWHPDNATRLLTSSEDDTYPTILSWDLRNARAPEKIFALPPQQLNTFTQNTLPRGHTKGILSISWNQSDANLLLSCGKDCRALVWNPNHDVESAYLGELTPGTNWAFQIDWCPRNPSILATSYFDRKVSIHSTQSLNVEALEAHEAVTAQAAGASTSGPGTTATSPFGMNAQGEANGADLFDKPDFFSSISGSSSEAMSHIPSGFSLDEAPKWLKRPVSAAWGFGGGLVCVGNLLSATGQGQSRTVRVRKVVSEGGVVKRAKQLVEADQAKALQSFAESKTNEGGEDKETWKTLASLFTTAVGNREQLISALGFDKVDVKTRVEEALEKLRLSESFGVDPATGKSLRGDEAVEEVVEGERVVSFVEPTATTNSGVEETLGEGEEQTPSERSGASGTSVDPSEPSSVSVISDTTSAAVESTTTAPSLFGDEAQPPTPGGPTFAIGGAPGEEDVFATIGRNRIPHINYGADASVAATIGSASRPSSVGSMAPLSLAAFASGIDKAKAFNILSKGASLPEGTPDVDGLVTKSLLMGDFEGAVGLCVVAKRWADALILSMQSKNDALLLETQKSYFQAQARLQASGEGGEGYLRILKDVVVGDLEDVVKNANLEEWKEVIVVVCTFASAPESFERLLETLGKRLEAKSSATLEAAEDASGDAVNSKEWRKRATLAYLAAKKLESLISIWADEMREEEACLSSTDVAEKTASKYGAHGLALQSFVEKVTVFRGAVGYADPTGLGATNPLVDENGDEVFVLAKLYDRYFEYAELLASQGLVKEGMEFVKLVPTNYKSAERERLLGSSGAPAVPNKTVQAKPGAPTGYAPRAANLSHSAYQTYGGYTSGTGATNVVSPQAPGYGFNPPTQPTTTPAYLPPGASAAPAPAPPNPYAPVPGSVSSAPSYNNPYSNPNPLTQPPHMRPPGAPIGGPPPPGKAAPAGPPPPPSTQHAAPKQGWNDLPSGVNFNNRGPSRTGSAGPGQAPKQAITSPFPNMPAPTSPIQSGAPPPPGAMRPPQGGMYAPPPGPGQGHPGPPLPGQGGPGGPPRMMSPPQGMMGGPPQRQPTPSQYGPPPGARGPGGVPPPGPGGMGMGGPPPPPQMGVPPPGPGQMRPPPPGAMGGAPRPPSQIASPPAPGAGPYGPPSTMGGIGRGTPPPNALGGAMSPPASGGMGMGAPQQQPPPPSGPYAPPPGGVPNRGPPGPPGAGPAPGPGPQGMGMGMGMGGPPARATPPPPGAPGQGPPPPGGPPGGGAPPAVRAAAGKAAPPPPKYPPGDRSHIPPNLQPAFEVISEQLERVKQTTPPQQRRLVEDLERRINPLFDALNCETLSAGVTQQLLVLVDAMRNHDRPAALAIHMELLTKGSQTDDIGLWMSGVKQLIMRL